MDISSGEHLAFKDAVYEAIFGVSERNRGKFDIRRYYPSNSLRLKKANSSSFEELFASTI